MVVVVVFRKVFLYKVHSLSYNSLHVMSKLYVQASEGESSTQYIICVSQTHAVPPNYCR